MSKLPFYGPTLAEGPPTGPLPAHPSHSFLPAGKSPRMQWEDPDGPAATPLSFDMLLGRFQLLGELFHSLVVGEAGLVVLVQLEALPHLAAEREIGVGAASLETQSRLFYPTPKTSAGVCGTTDGGRSSHSLQRLLVLP